MRVASNRVRIQWLRVNARTAAPCERAQHGIEVDGADNVTIRSNWVTAAGDGDPFEGPCGMVNGITVNDGSDNALVLSNRVRNFGLVGILAHSAANARVVNNAVHYGREQPPCRAARVCLRASRRAVRPAIPTLTHGIRFYGSTGEVRLNGVTSADAVTAGEPWALHTAISVVSGVGVRISGNHTERTTYGILAENLDGGTIRRNNLTGFSTPVPIAGPASYATSAAIDLIESDGNLVDQNRGTRFLDGGYVHPDSTENTLTDNNFLGNVMADCVDLTGNTLPAGSTVIKNSWSGNLGNADYPVGLCANGPI